MGPTGQTGQAGQTGQTGQTGNTATRMKRHMSESDDCDDVFSEESSKDQCSSPGDDCQLMSRKKRRGVIEKRRRDRINTSLIELKRLVPTAFEKQGSAKLEKAEILQMTVDHLKMLHAKGMDALAYDPHKFAMDYHNIGFRECASEVARYLVTVEGMDIQDPLRLRLMSHLQCFAAQRELATKQSSVSTTAPWYTASNQAYNPNNPQTFPPTTQHSNDSHSKYDHYEVNSSTGYNQSPPSSATVSSSKQGHTLTPLTTSLGYSGHQYMNLGASGLGHSNQSFNASAANMKPYRPWGAEVAY